MNQQFEIQIRSAGLPDLPEIQNLFVTTISSICIHDYSPDQINAWTSSIKNTERWSGKINSQYFLVALSDHKIVGFASLEKKDYLDFLYVHKDFQRRGIALKLYNLIEVEALNRGAMVLNSDVSITAKPFFEKNGFTVLQPQTVMIDGIEIANFKMTKKVYKTIL